MRDMGIQRGTGIPLEEARRILAAQPFSVLLGAELIAFEEGKVEMALPIRDELKQQHGFVHGGVISYLADNALTGAGAFVLGPAVVTSEYKIDYVRPALGEVLIARAAVVAAGRRQAVYRCDVLVRQNGEEKLCAVAQGTIVRLEGEA